jgi:2-keto-4-pentenoate hydratase
MVNPWDDPRIARGMRAQLAGRRERLTAGDEPVGWKVGFGAPAAMSKLRIDAPLVGFLTRSRVLESGATASLAGFVKPVAEPEIAVHMGADLPGGGDLAAAAAAVGALGPAIELADLNPPPEEIEAILAGNIYHRHVLLGPQDAARAGCKVDGLTGRVFRRGAEAARTSDPQANTGKLVVIVRHVADLLAAFGERLRAGELIITGSIVPPLFLEADENGVSYELDPIGGVSVRFART